MWVTTNRYSCNSIPSLVKILSYSTNISKIKIKNKEIFRRRGTVIDLEDWQFTPKLQQKYPVKAFQQTYYNIQKEGRRNWLMAAPSMDLIRVIYPEYKGRVYQKFIKADIAGQISTYVKAYDIQAQGAENNPSYYQKIISEITQQIKKENKNIKVFAELSVPEYPSKINECNILQDIKNTKKIISGYWIAMPNTKLMQKNKISMNQIDTVIKIIND